MSDIYILKECRQGRWCRWCRLGRLGRRAKALFAYVPITSEYACVGPGVVTLGTLLSNE